MPKTYDVIVLGAQGAMGSAVSCQLKGLDKTLMVLGLDQYSGAHVYGSSHGESRIIRKAICEGEECVDLVLESYRLWEELEQNSGEQLLVKCGGLLIGSHTECPFHGTDNFLKETIAVARRRSISHDVLNARWIRADFPQFNVQDHEYGYYEPSAGFVRPEQCITIQLQKAHKDGVEFITDHVIEWQASNAGVVVKTTKAIYHASKLIISAGPWIDQLLTSRYARLFKVYRQVMYWFGVSRSINQYSVPRFPVFIWGRPEGIVYGFPALSGKFGGLKVAGEQYDTKTTPQSINRTVDAQEIENMYKIVHPRLPGLTSKCIRADTCMYTRTPDDKFIIDFHPKHKNVIVASPCSGHGFKHSAAIGKVLSQLAVNNHTDFNIKPFSFSRFGLF